MSSLIDRNDLCAENAKIDINSLVKLAEIAVFRTTRDVEDRFRDIRDNSFKDARSKIACVSDAERLAFAAKDLHTVISMHYLLTEARDTRSNVTIVK
jgi:hypothetical protein